jgi:hypothetical protein
MPSSSLAALHLKGLTVWRDVRALRSQPPGKADKGDRRRIFSSALEQAEELFIAAGTVGYAARPIMLFYGLSQAGRAIAAASTAADKNDYRLSKHGITVPNLGQRPDLHQLTVKDEGVGSFTQLAELMDSISLPGGVALGQIWATIPDLSTFPLLQNETYLRPLKLRDSHEAPGFAKWVVGLPKNPEGYKPTTITEKEVQRILSKYPALARSMPFDHDEDYADHILPSDLDYTTCILRCWLTRNVLDRPYRNDRDRWVFPPIDDGGRSLHPLLAWWAVLYTLSMLARYEPASWVSQLQVDNSSVAVPLEAALDHAVDTCPQLILQAIHTVTEL